MDDGLKLIDGDNTAAIGLLKRTFEDTLSSALNLKRVSAPLFVDPDTGLIALLNIMKLGGAFPRDFEFFPGGKFLLAGLKMSGILRSYAYNSSKCTLEPVMDMAGLYRPLFIKFGNPA